MVDGCDSVRELLPAYALDGLALEDRWQVDQHLDACPDCRERLDGYRAVGHVLLTSVTPVEPPPGLRASLIASVASKAVEPQPHPRRGWPAWRGLAAGTALLLLVANVFLFYETRSLARQQEQLAAQLVEDQTTLGLAAYPSTRTALVRGDGTYGTFLFEPDLPVSVLYAWGLEPLTSGETYQAWLIEPDGDRVDGGIFQVEPETGFVRLLIRAPQVLSAYVGIGVTIEPNGGSPAPTGPRVLGADL